MGTTGTKWKIIFMFDSPFTGKVYSYFFLQLTHVKPRSTTLVIKIKNRIIHRFSEPASACTQRRNKSLMLCKAWNKYRANISLLFNSARRWTRFKRKCKLFASFFSFRAHIFVWYRNDVNIHKYSLRNDTALFILLLYRREQCA